MNASHPTSPALEAALAPLLAELGYELVALEAGAAGGVLRLYIDHLSADAGATAGITLADCGRVSERVGDWLDAGEVGGEAPAGPYTLEVSSPGLDRPLCRPAHFCRFVGREVAVHLARPVGEAGARRLRGRLARAAASGGGAIVVDTDAGAVEVDYPSITRARLVPDFGQGPAKKERRHGR